MNILENVYGILFTPNKTFVELANRQNLVSSFFIVLFLSILASFKVVDDFQIPLYSIVAVILLIYLIYLITWVFESLFLTLAADFLGGSGKITDTMIGISYSMLPLMFLYPISVVTSGATRMLLDTFIYFWSLYLLITSIKEIHRISTGKAIWSIVSLIGLAISLITVIFILIALISMIFAFGTV